MDLEQVSPAVPEQVSEEKVWQWRPRRWKIAMIILAVILITGTIIIRFASGDAQNEDKKGMGVWIYNFNLIVLLLFALWTVFWEREWPVWKRIAWIFGLWLAHGFLAFVPFGILTGMLTGGLIGNATVGSFLLGILVMRRSTFFVEPAPPSAKKSWFKWW